MVFPWMFEEFEALRPLKEAADILAKKADWPQLYKLETLRKNSVPVAGATYYEDMYVDFELAQVRSRPSCLVGVALEQSNTPRPIYVIEIAAATSLCIRVARNDTALT